MTKLNTTRGGSRLGAGRPKSESAKVIQTRVKESLIEEFKAMVKVWKATRYKKDA